MEVSLVLRVHLRSLKLLMKPGKITEWVVDRCKFNLTVESFVVCGLKAKALLSAVQSYDLNMMFIFI